MLKKNLSRPIGKSMDRSRIGLIFEGNLDQGNTYERLCDIFLSFII